MLKRIILILTFVLPVLGILLFNFFSKSHFDIPVYHQDSLPDNIRCDAVSVPYSINEETPFLTRDSIPSFPFKSDNIKIVAIESADELSLSSLNRIADEFYAIDDVKIYSINQNAIDSKVPVSSNIQHLYFVNSSDKLNECILLITKTEVNAVLIDQSNKIRGYYNLQDSDLADSLIVETKILLYQIDNPNEAQ